MCHGDAPHAGDELERLTISESGSSGQPAIVFLHGVGNTGAMWRPHMAALADFHTLAVDLPGHGQSRRLRWATRARAAELVAQLIETRAPAGRASVVGLSLGGSVAYDLLARRPELLERVVIDGAGVVGTRLAPFFKLGVALVSPLVGRAFVGRIIARAVGLSDRAAIADFAAQLGQVDPRSFRRAFAQAQDVRLSEALLRAPCPTLLVAGERELAVVRGSNRLLADLMPHAKARMVPGAGHGWLAIAPELHIEMVRAWMTGRELPPALVPETSPRPRVPLPASVAIGRSASR